MCNVYCVLSTHTFMYPIAIYTEAVPFMTFSEVETISNLFPRLSRTLKMRRRWICLCTKKKLDFSYASVLAVLKLQSIIICNAFQFIRICQKIIHALERPAKVMWPSNDDGNDDDKHTEHIQLRNRMRGFIDEYLFGSFFIFYTYIYIFLATLIHYASGKKP